MQVPPQTNPTDLWEWSLALVVLCIAQRERGVTLVSLANWHEISSFQCRFSKQAELTSSACNNTFATRLPEEHPHWWDRQFYGGNGWLCWNYECFGFGSHWNGDAMWVIWNAKWCELQVMWREWSLLPVSTILIGFPSFQMRIVIISVFAQR